MSYDQFLKEMTAIEGVSNVDICTEPRPGMFFGYYKVSFICHSPDGSELSAAVKHFERSKAFEAILNLATAFCSQPVL